MMVVVTDARIIGEEPDGEQVELIRPGLIREAQSGPVGEPQVLVSPATLALIGPGPQGCRYLKCSSEYN
jgi:hypothetical protein